MASEGKSTSSLRVRIFPPLIDGKSTELPTLAGTYRELLQNHGHDKSNPYLREWFTEYQGKRKHAEEAQSANDDIIRRLVIDPF